MVLRQQPRYHHGPRWQCRPLGQAWPPWQHCPWTLCPRMAAQTSPAPALAWCSMVSGVIDINTDPGCGRAKNTDMVLGHSPGLENTTSPPNQLDPGGVTALGHSDQHIPAGSTAFMAIGCVHMDPSGNIGQGQQHSPQLQKDQGPRHGRWQQSR